MSLLASSRMELGWNYPKLNALFNAVTNYRNKMMKGIISSYKDYDQVRFLIVQIFCCDWINRSLAESCSLSQQDDNNKCLWIHHWIVLQLIHPHFRPRAGYDFEDSYILYKDNGLNFVHDNYSDFIMTTDNDAFQEQYLKTLGCKPPKKLPYGIVWKGTKMEDDVTTMWMVIVYVLMCLELSV